MKIRYEIREFTAGQTFSRQLGRRLRTRKSALRSVRLLKAQGREVYATPLQIYWPRGKGGLG